MNFYNFKFCVTDFQFIYPKGTDKELRNTINPSYVKVLGVSIDERNVFHSCYLFDSFDSFGLDLDSLKEKLSSNCVLVGKGILSNDKDYNRTLSLTSYDFKDSFEIIIK